MRRKKPFLIGLTGSIGMGKSTTAEMFGDLGAAVWDADAAVNRLYAKGGRGVAAIESIHPSAIADRSVDKQALNRWISQDETALGKIEAVIHPMVADDRSDFIEKSKSDIVLLDIPLLFETGQQDLMDLVCVVSAPADIQRQRVLSRPGMTAAQFEAINEKQMSDREKRALADTVIPTESIDGTKSKVAEIMAVVRRKLKDA